MAVAVAVFDIKASTARTDVLTALNRLVDALRTSAAPALVQVAWGDEVEAVLPSSMDLWALYVSARACLGELPFYMGVGFGEVAALPLPGPAASVHELNGTAFKAARLAVDRIKREATAGVALGFEVPESPSLTIALNTYPRMLDAALGQMTRKQRTYFDDLILGLSQREIAQRHHVSQPTVSISLQRAGADQLAHMRDGLTALLSVVAKEVGWGLTAEEVLES